MGKSKAPTLNSYTSISISSLQKGNEFLEQILSSKIKLFPRKIDKPVILYGAGSLGKMAKDFFDYLNIPFLYIVDRNASKYKNDKFWESVKIIHPDYVSEKDKKNSLLIICIATSPLIALQDELKNGGWKDVAFFYDVSEAYRGRYPLNNGWFLGKLDKKEKELVKKIFSALKDDASRAYYLQFLAWRKLRIELLFSGLKTNNDDRFFISEIVSALGEDEIFVDCGAHKGFVVEKFLRIVNNKYRAIYALEPDLDSYKIIKTRLKNISGIKIMKCAIGYKNAKERFYQGFDFASRLNKNGNVLIETKTLDSLNIRPTFIKMHLEGGELNALKGSMGIIQKLRPIIAVTIYHNPDGAWKIPFYLISNTKNYNYYIRLHSWGGTGAVFYALPKERNKYG